MVDGGVPFHMVSDQAGNIGKAYGVYDENMGIELRGRFIIDPDGVIQAMEVLTPPVGRMFAETVRQFQRVPARARQQGYRGDAGGLAAGPADAQARAGPRRQRVEGLEPEDGEVGRPSSLHRIPGSLVAPGDPLLPDRPPRPPPLPHRSEPPPRRSQVLRYSRCRGSATGRRGRRRGGGGVRRHRLRRGCAGRRGHGARERGAVPAAKVRISGGGRCNVTHACFDARELRGGYPRGERALIGPFGVFQPRDTVAWFEARGVR